MAISDAIEGYFIMGNQQIYLPIGGPYPIPYEFEADTMLVPRGKFSVLWALEKGELTSAEALIYLCLNHGSTWNSGATWCMSGTYLSEILGTGMSKRHALRILSSLNDKGWIETINKNNPAGNRYRVRHHLCDREDMPINSDGKPLKFAVPRGPGGPLERCFEGDISWKAALVWIVLKRRSNWKAHEDTAGQTESATLLSLSKTCRMKHTRFQEVLTELTEAGMLQRLTPKSQRSVFQLYPKPFPKPLLPASIREPTPSKPTQEIPSQPIRDGEGYCNEKFYFSLNFEYRCDRETGAIERQVEGKWKQISDFHRAQRMNSDILAYFMRKTAYAPK